MFRRHTPPFSIVISVDGRKRCENASVDEKLFMRFQEIENGGFRKRISVDRS